MWFDVVKEGFRYKTNRGCVIIDAASFSCLKVYFNLPVDKNGTVSC